MAMWDSFRSTQKKLLNKKNVGEMFPVLDYIPDEKMFILDPNGLGFMIVAQPLPGISPTLRNSMEALFTLQFPAHATLVISLVANRDLRVIRKNFRDIRYNRMNPTDHEFENLLSDIQADYLDQAIDVGVLPDHRNNMRARNFEVWFSVTIPTKTQHPTVAEVKAAKKLQGEIFSTLDKCGMSPFIANEFHWLRRMQVLLNPGKRTQWAESPTHVKPTVPLRHQIMEPGRMMTIDKEGIVLAGNPAHPDENRVIRVLNCYRRPEYLHFGCMYDIYSSWMTGDGGIFDDFMLSLNVHYPDEKGARRKFNTKSRLVTQQEMSGVGRLSSRLKYQYDDCKLLEHELDQEHHRLIDCWLQFNLFIDDNEEKNERVENTIAYLRSKGYGYASDSVAALPLMLEMLPLCHAYDKTLRSGLNRSEQYTTKALLYMAPIFGPWKGNSSDPVFYGVTREGQVVSLDTFKTSASFNIAIAAKSGAGKSVLGGNLIKQIITTGVKDVIEDGGQAFAIDAGDSYLGLSQQFSSSQYISFGNATCSLDPFANMERVLSDPSTTENDRTDIMIMVGNLIKIMVSPSASLVEYQSARIDAIVQHMCAVDPENASITQFAEICATDEDPRVRDMAALIHNYTLHGPYGRMFDRRAGLPPVSFDASFVVCELGDLKNKPDLQTVVLMSIIQQAQDAMFLRKDGKRRMFLLDEAWEYIGSSANNSNNAFFARFVEAGWRRFRKTRAQGVCITQEISDYYQSTTGRAILANSPWVFCLMQEADTISRLETEKLIDAEPWLFNLMRSIHTVKGQYSEILVRYSGIEQIIRLYADELSMMIHSTDPEDRRLVQRFVDDGYSTRDAISQAVQFKKRRAA